jgi:sterol desaturase/sphingolipid hydroxylase (fatty acid hydroxylase superfamily)
MASQLLQRPLPRKSQRVRPEDTCRMFENDFLERFSRIHPSTPFVVWVPIATLFVVRSVLRHDLPPAMIAAMFFAGIFAWTFAEYILHRWVFHWTNDTPWGKRIHFLLHGVHHDFPNDKDRLVMPLPTSVPLAVIFYSLFAAIFGSAVGGPFFSGFVIGYLFYDGTHYFVHHFVPRSRWGKFLRRHHMTHHFADHHGGFGVSSPLWDYVFRTLPTKKKTADA